MKLLKKDGTIDVMERLSFVTNLERIMKNVSKWIGVTLVTAAALSTTACNTLQGAGQDIKSTGKAIEKSAE